MSHLCSIFCVLFTDGFTSFPYPVEEEIFRFLFELTKSFQQISLSFSLIGQSFEKSISYWPPRPLGQHHKGD